MPLLLVIWILGPEIGDERLQMGHRGIYSRKFHEFSQLSCVWSNDNATTNTEFQFQSTEKLYIGNRKKRFLELEENTILD